MTFYDPREAATAGAHMVGKNPVDDKIRFIVDRVSDPEARPCRGATKRKVDRWSFRTLKTPAEFNARFGATEGEWFSVGEKHGTYAGGIKRCFPGDLDVWTIDLTPKQVLDFAREHGEVILSAHHFLADDYPHLRIFDGYL